MQGRLPYTRDDRRGTAASTHFTVDGKNGIPYDPCLWPDRDLRTSGDVRLESRLGQRKRRRKSQA